MKNFILNRGTCHTKWTILGQISEDKMNFLHEVSLRLKLYKHQSYIKHKYLLLETSLPTQMAWVKGLSRWSLKLCSNFCNFLTIFSWYLSSRRHSMICSSLVQSMGFSRIDIRLAGMTTLEPSLFMGMWIDLSLSCSSSDTWLSWSSRCGKIFSSGYSS